MRVLVTGARDHPDREYVVGVLDALPREGLVIVVGDCPTGVDRWALDWAFAHHVPTDVFMARWATFRLAAGPERNERMVASGADLCLAFPAGESRGTRGCARLARKAGIDTRVHEHAEGMQWPRR